MFKLLFSFKGRIGRAQYWLTNLGVGVIWVLIVGLLFAMFPPTPMGPGQQPQPSPGMIIGLVITYIPVLWIGLSLAVKRGHDRGRSGWYQLLSLVPLANIWLFIDQAFLRGVDATNEWGPPAVPRPAM
jgi:uncharacterized membrane protein YhaH (DUF805 family)